jgi:hypothetical protein
MKSNIVKSFLNVLVDQLFDGKEKKDFNEKFQCFVLNVRSFKINLLYRATENGDKISQIYKCFNEINNKLEGKERAFITFIKVDNTIIIFLTDSIWKITNKFQNKIELYIKTLKNLFDEIKSLRDEKGILFSKDKIMIGDNYENCIEINDNFLKNKSCSIQQSNDSIWLKINKNFDLKDAFKIDEMEIIYFYFEK